jgi:hypothetical protein
MDSCDGHTRRGCRYGRPLRRTEQKGPMRTVLVVVANVAIEHSSEMSFVYDKETIGALRAHRSHPALGYSVRVRCSYGGSHDPRPFATPHAVEARAELGVAITQEELDGEACISELRGHVAGALGDPVPGGVLRDARKTCRVS